ncbi:hypothetical protein BCV72DRAFT_305651 [Rhizopus microsporus var. microsporus]|uniref:Uncharacterized protein n=1 Tax=Rhizopus microsporus var. microsporus TaxID=86635 RepID=A0A1X0R2K4_RHIZD|nr:hypothetical protein BCV72DRAFT_305651 [Rhizopus microsporus var. microsporus]
MNNINTPLSEFSMEELYQEFSRRMQTEQEQRSNGAPIPVEILTELENSTEIQRQDNIKRFKRSINLYNELQKRKVGANKVINEIYKLIETTRQQTKAAIEIYEQLTHVLEIIEGGQDPRPLLNRAQTQSHRLAIFGLLQGKL